MKNEKRLFPENKMFINCLYTFSEYEKTDENMSDMGGFKPRSRKLPDSVILVHKDKEGNKNFTMIEEPSYTYYVTKDIPAQYAKAPGGYEYRYISLDDVKPVTTKFSKRFSSMVKNTTNEEVKKFYNKCKLNKDYKAMQNLHMFKEFHNSDVNITDYFVDKFCEENDQEKNFFSLDLASFDIEVDGADYKGFPDEREAPCPVNMITYFNFKSNTLYVFMRKYDTDTFKELVTKNIQTKMKEVLKTYKEYFGKIHIVNKLFSYDNEIGLIKAFFDRVNEDKPDYCLAWNARFDLFTLYNRIIQAGYDPADIMCPEDFPIKKVIMKFDNSDGAKKDFTGRTDIFNIYGYTVWLDMMVLYGNITRPMGKKDSYQLNAIGLEETGLGKENLSDDNTSIKTAHLDNYSLFYKYSCVDTMLLALIIKNTGYVDLLHTIVTLTHTRANKALTKTVCLRNYVNIFYRNKGYVISNNRCNLHFEDRTGISGAYVAPPELIDNVGSINGIPSNKCLDLVIDEDLSSMYPSILRAFNISSSTAEFRVIVKKTLDTYAITQNEEGKDEKVYDEEDITKEYMEKYISEDVVNYYHEYRNLPDYEEMLDLFKKSA